MKKVELPGLDAHYFYEKLDSGLECFLLPYENKNNYFITYATKFGSNQTSFLPPDEKTMVKVPDGIAHFLEHKMFEQEDGIDPFTYYAKTGTGANASTTFDSTQYICYGTKNIEENLDYLLNYVNEPYFTDENVQKEKGIIAEEIKMYDDIPEWTLEEELRKSIYHVHPMRIDIAGTVDEINKITKEDLYTCYNLYYQPSNMFLIVAGKFDPEKIMEVIHNNKHIQQKQEKKRVIEKEYNEKASVKEKYKEIKMNVVVPKIGYALKIDRNKLKIKDDFLLDLYLQMFTTIVFGISSKFREKVRNEQLMTSFYTHWDKADHFKTLLIMSETSKPKELLRAIQEEMHDLTILEEDVERMKKVWISSEVKMIDMVETSVNNMFDDIIKYGKPIANKIEIIRQLDVKVLNQLLKTLDKDNFVEVIMYPNEVK